MQYNRPRAHTLPPSISHDLLPESAIKLSHSNLPTDSLLISNIPPSPTISNSTAFTTLLANFGTLRGVYSVISSSDSNLVIIARFASIASSINAATTLNNSQLYPGYNCIIGYIHILNINLNINPINLPLPITPPPLPQLQTNNIQNNIPNLPPLEQILPIFNKITNLIVSDECITPIFKSTLNSSLNFTHSTNLGSPPQSSSNSSNTISTIFLRDLKRKIDNNTLTNIQSNEILSLLSDKNQLSILSNDHLGNTIIQYLIQNSNPFTLDIIINSISPFLQQISIHKNGTWVAQKLINSINNKRQMKLITNSIKPYIHLLFNDTYANYVIHGLLKFNYPFNTIIFQSLLSKFNIISINRFGSRAIRTCLETNYQPNIDNPLNDCCLLIIIAILSWSFNLIIDINGSLLINWLLDCDLIIDRYYYLSYILVNDELYSINNKFITICNNKLGTLTLLKLLNYKNDSRIIDLLLNKIMNNLNEIINTNTNSNISINFIHRIIHLQHIEPNLKNQFLNKLKSYLLTIEINSNSLKRLADDCGIITNSNININSINNNINSNRLRSNSDLNVYNNMNIMGLNNNNNMNVNSMMNINNMNGINSMNTMINNNNNTLRSRTNSLFSYSTDRSFDELEIDKNILETLNSLGL